jgi:hypothetical protein
MEFANAQDRVPQKDLSYGVKIAGKLSAYPLALKIF